MVILVNKVIEAGTGLLSRQVTPQSLRESRHYYGYQHGNWSFPSDILLNISQSNIYDRYGNHSLQRVDHEEVD